MSEGAVSDRHREWDLPVLFCVAAGDADFLDQAKGATAGIPHAESAIVEDRPSRDG